MGLFGFGKKKYGFHRKKGDFVDLAELHKRKQEKLEKIRGHHEDDHNESGLSQEKTHGLGFLGSIALSRSNQEDSDESIDLSKDINEKKKRLAKRLINMTEKIEELSNQVYHLTKRIEVLEKRTSVNNFE